MKRIVERFNNNETVIFIKEIWSNKKTRSWVGLGFYFIFLLIIGMIIRMSPDVPVSLESEKLEYSVENIVVDLENRIKEDYKYKLYISNEEIEGTLENGTNSFVYQGYNYIYIYNKLYLNTNSNLELVNNLLNTDVPIEFININNVLDSIKNLNCRYDSKIDECFEVIYEVLPEKFILVSEMDNLEIRLIGNNDKVNKIKISYKNNDYVLEII